MTSDKSYATEQRLNTLIGQLLGLPQAVAALPQGLFPDPWNTLGGIGGPSGWTSDHGRYRMTLEGDVEIDIMLHGTSGSGTAGTITYANNLAVGYRPAIDRIYPLGVNTTGGANAFAHVQTDGTFTLIVPAQSKIGCNILMPLD